MTMIARVADALPLAASMQEDEQVNKSNVFLKLVMVHNPAHDLFSIGHFLCRVRVVDCCDLRNGAERQ